MLADLVRTDRPAAVVSFVSPAHVYGALATVLMPARLGVPVWYRLSPYGAMPVVDARRVVVVAIPWIFQLLLTHMAWVREFDHVTVLHSSAMLPETARDFLAEAGAGRAAIVEVLGSTEAGAIATRRWRAGDPPPWTLLDDVSFAAADAGGVPDSGAADHGVPDHGAPDHGAPDEVPLIIRSPRLAFRPGGPPPRVWEADDHVQRLDGRTFRFAGRRTRLVKLNGRRVNLDEVEHALRADLHCADLAVVPVADRMIGEHVDLLVVPHPGTTLADIDLAAVRTRLGVRPRRVRVVSRIDRSDVGKLRDPRNTPINDLEVTS